MVPVTEIIDCSYRQEQTRYTGRNQLETRTPVMKIYSVPNHTRLQTSPLKGTLTPSHTLTQYTRQVIIALDIWNNPINTGENANNDGQRAFQNKQAESMSEDSQRAVFR